MGKTKHKKHHRHEDGDGEEAGDDASNPGLKMVLFKTNGKLNLAKPKTKNGKIDKRYKTVQFINKNGTRDKRTTLTRKR